MVGLYGFFWRSIAPRLGVQPEEPFTVEESLALSTTLEQTRRRIDDALAGDASLWRIRPPLP